MKMRFATCVLAVLLAPCAARAQGSAADSAWVRGDRVAAQRLYLQRIETRPDDATALFRLALISGWRRHHEESIVWLDRLLAIQPEDRDARVARARSLAAIGRFTEARVLVDSVLAGHPDEVGALQLDARFSGWDGDAGRSESLWRQALALDPNNTETQVGLTQNLRWQGRTGEAMRIIRPLLAVLPHDTDVRTQHDWVAQAYRPRVRSIITRETDSDGNAITSLTLSGAVRARHNGEVRAAAWHRAADLQVGVGRDAVARGANVAYAVEGPAGWGFVAGVGASTSNLEDSGTHASFSSSLTTPRNRRLIATLDLSRTPWDYTVPLVENGVVVDEATAQVDVTANRDWSVRLSGSAARFDVSRDRTDTRRIAAQLAVTRRISDPFVLVLGARTFGFDEDVNGGFFDPDFYGIADIALAWRREGLRTTLEADAAPGIQKIRSNGAVSGAMRAAATFTIAARPGRNISIRGVWANTGFQPVTADAGGAYRYSAITAGFSWWF